MRTQHAASRCAWMVADTFPVHQAVAHCSPPAKLDEDVHPYFPSFPRRGWTRPCRGRGGRLRMVALPSHGQRPSPKLEYARRMV
jgi:hypothetical protein